MMILLLVLAVLGVGVWWWWRKRDKAPAGGDVPINLSGLILLTGVPGAGKTLRMMQYMQAAIAAGRPVYVCNVEGLNLPGAIPFDDPHDWQDLPPGAVLFVDEAQRYFRARRGMVDPPASILAMETIRHDGVCIVMTTQQATYLDKHIRGLIGRHEHLVEVVASKLSNVYAFRSCREDVTPSSLADATYLAWAHPTQLHGAYKSAEVHTKRTVISLRTKLLAAGVVFAVGMLVYAFGFAGNSSDAEEPRAAPAAGVPVGDKDARREERTPLTDAEYFARMVPRMEGAAWSAPIYDDVNEVAAAPRVVCMIGSTCRCITDQGTRYRVSQGRCRLIVEEGGIFNPFAQPAEAAQGVAGNTPPQEDAAASAPAPEAAGGVGEASNVQQGYGAMRPGAATSTQTRS